MQYEYKQTNKKFINYLGLFFINNYLIYKIIVFIDKNNNIKTFYKIITPKVLLIINKSYKDFIYT